MSVTDDKREIWVEDRETEFEKAYRHEMKRIMDSYPGRN